MSDQKAKVIPLLRKRVLSHQTNAYELYKNIMIDDNLWEKIYPNFLKEMEKKLTRYEFGDILVTEKEYSKLLDQLKKYNSAPMIRKYLPELYPHRKKRSQHSTMIKLSYLNQKKILLTRQGNSEKIWMTFSRSVVMANLFRDGSNSSNYNWQTNLNFLNFFRWQQEILRCQRRIIEICL